MKPPIRITTTHFDYKGEILPLLANKGREVFGAHFRIYPEDLYVIIPVIGWMLRDEDVAQQFGIDLHKGIFFHGGIGTGKTQLMKLMQYIADFSFQNCDKISTEFSLHGPKALNAYTQKAWCFDDLGKEAIAHHYGTKCEVMKKILMARYEAFMDQGTITHIVTSMSPLDIEQRYGREVRSRMREMFNKISFDKETRDKRGPIKMDKRA